ncbi:MAG: Flp pilus assembly protein CpaB [Bacteriovoracaceae bacterium]|nr:Flp pilus assembly protein CpaB [Bacteriovoracaceae bacterium]
MNTRAFSLAIILALAAMFLVHTYIEDERSNTLKKYGELVTVVVAKRDIKELELLDDSKLEMMEVPKNFAMPGTFSKMKELMNTVAMVPIKKGEQITSPRVSYPGIKTGLSRQVSPGKRAISITITERQAVSKLIKPGDRVDVLAAIDYSSGQKHRQKTTTVLQDVLVLSTGMNMTNSLPIYGKKTDKVIKAMNLSVYSAYNTVALELTSFEAQKLVFLLTYANAQPYLVLRNNNDSARVNIKPTKIFDVLGEDSMEAKAFFVEKYSKSKKK